MATHRYYRLSLSANWTFGTNLVIGEIEMRASIDGSGANLSTTGNGTATADATVSTYYASNAFDGSTSTFWMGNTAPAWIKWDFGAGNEKDIRHLTIVNAGSNNSGSPSNFLFQYSDDDSTWTPWIVGQNASDVASARTAFPWVAFGSGPLALTAPTPALVGYGKGSAALSVTPALVGYVAPRVSLASPTPTLYFSAGGGGALTAPSATLGATGYDGVVTNAFVGTAPIPTLSANSGGSVALAVPGPSLGVTGTFWQRGTAALTAPTPVIAASASVSGMSVAAISARAATLVGYSGAVCSVTLTGGLTVAASGATGATGAAALRLPLYQLVASGTKQNTGQANLLAPTPTLGATAQAWLIAPTARLVLIGTAVVTATYEAYAVNLNHQPAPGVTPIDEVTHYTNFPFDQIVRYQNSYFGVAADGLYLLAGTTDYATPTPTPIPWSWRTAITDMDTPLTKMIESIYFGGRLGAAATVALYVGEDGAQSYSYSTPRDSHVQNYRQVVGRGIKSRYYALGVSGSTTMELDDVEFLTTKSTRRI